MNQFKEYLSLVLLLENWEKLGEACLERLTDLITCWNYGLL